MRSAADIEEVGCPLPAAVVLRMLSTRSCWASSCHCCCCPVACCCGVVAMSHALLIRCVGTGLRAVRALHVAVQRACHDAGKVACQLRVGDDAGGAEVAGLPLRLQIDVRAKGDDGDRARGLPGGSDSRAPIEAARASVHEDEGWRPLGQRLAEGIELADGACVE